jgi:cell division protein FtsB
MSGRLHARSKASKGPKGPAKTTRPAKTPKTTRTAKTTRPAKTANKLKPRAKTADRGRGPAAPRRTGPVRSIGIRKGPARAAGPGGAAKRKPTSHMVRRNRVPVAVGALFALVVLGTSFPASALLSQHGQLSAAGTQLSQLQHENRLLTEQEHQLSSTAEIKRLARLDYQLVSPGQSLYDILPAAGHAAGTVPGRTVTGDPGLQPLVAPSNAPDMSPDPGLPRAPASSGSTPSSAPAGVAGTTGSGRAGTPSSGGSIATPRPSSFWSRVTDTLEFWK